MVLEKAKGKEYETYLEIHPNGYRISLVKCLPFGCYYTKYSFNTTDKERAEKVFDAFTKKHIITYH